MTQLNKDILPDAYNEFLSDVATAVQQHRVQAIQSVQTISNQLYWNIGELIIQKQLVAEYSNVNQVDSHLEIPNMKQVVSHLKCFKLTN